MSCLAVSAATDHLENDHIENGLRDVHVVYASGIVDFMGRARCKLTPDHDFQMTYTGARHSLSQ